MKKNISRGLLLILWLFLYMLLLGLIQITQLMKGVSLLVLGVSIVGTILLSLLVLFYNYLYKNMKRSISGLNIKFQSLWGPIILYFLFMLLQVLFPIKASTNQQIFISLIHSVPIGTFLNTVIFAPILEEYIFRGMLRSYFFSDITSMRQALLYCFISAIFFSLIHMPNTFVHFLIYGTMGFTFSWIYLAKNDLRYPIGLHMINNLIAFLLAL